LFGYSDQGDLTSYLSGYFDTTTAGGKLDRTSYEKILGEIGSDVCCVLFISDNEKELRAASMAGLRVVLASRPGNNPVLLEEGEVFETVEKFDEMKME
jgi:enolase-phosphatase E1